MSDESDDISGELLRVEHELSQLEAEVVHQQALELEARALLVTLRRDRSRLRRTPWSREVRIAGLALGSTLVIAGAFALDPDFGALGTASAFAVLIWEAVR